ncbi:MAG: hypothetical protein EOO22_12810 [Comamonadaceae bacterium]|nr:MAG: hypothetical protein EOO22_12810 [Comamonadaceae bacterium]
MTITYMEYPLNATHDLSPLPRLSARQLHALAISLRRDAAQGDATADSVAAALESVSRRRAARTVRGVMRQLAEIVIVRAMHMAQVLAQPARTAQRPVKAPRKEQPTLTAPAVRQALHMVLNGDGLAPEVCESLTTQGLAEWVDYQHGTPIDLNHPRSLLRVTPVGQRQLEAELVD